MAPSASLLGLTSFDSIPYFELPSCRFKPITLLICVQFNLGSVIVVSAHVVEAIFFSSKFSLRAFVLEITQ
jgi:hypothetical protein